MKIFVSFFLTISTFLGMTAFGGSDADMTNEAYKNDTEIVEDTSLYTSDNIDDLYEIRSELALDFDNNIDKINEIDKRLEELGVEELSVKEVYEKVYETNVGMSRVALNTSTTVKWTSTRQTTVFNGKTYEMQIIRGVPATASSELAYTFKVPACDATNATVLLNISDIGAYSGTATCDSTLKNRKYSDIFGTATGTKTVSGQATISSDYIYVFVKYSGDLDAGNQIKAYVGCRAQIDTVFSSGTSKSVTGIMYSEGYNSYTSIACKNFYDYNNGNSNFIYNYIIYSFNYKLCSKFATYKLQYPLSGY